jgi:TolB protein
MCRTGLYLVLVAGAVALGALSATRPPVRGSWRATGAIQPRLSPDGATVAVSYQGAIWRLPRDGGVMRRLTSDARWDSDPAWSPDGRRIAYLSSGEVRLIEAESGALAGTARPAAQGKLTFDPAGRRLLGNFRTGTALALGWLDLESGKAASLLDPPRTLGVHALSPDGSTVAYATNQDVPGQQGGNDGPEGDLWTVPAAGGEPKKLARFPSRVFDLAWTGDELIVVSDAGGAHNDLWSVPLNDPDRPRKLTFGQADEDAPTVAVARLIYTDNREGATALVDRDLRSGDERTIVVTGLDFGRPSGVVALEFTDGETGRPIVARVSVQEENGKTIAPPGSLYRIHETMDFYADRAADVVVPSGKHVLRAWHGPEYRMAQEAFEVAAGGRVKLKVALTRWAHPQAGGWHSGENHIHANYGYGHWYNTPAEMRLMIEGEGLEVANFVVANSDTDGIFDREYFLGRPDPHSTPETVLYWNQEFRATLWGHMTLVDLKQLVEPIMTGFKDTTNPWDVPTNSDIADRVHLQKGHVNYTHPAQNPKDPYATAYSAKSIPVDVALGKIDSIDINGSFEATVPLWYRLLNCGFHLPASAGTDCFLNRIRSRLPGADRVYVNCEGAFSYDAWVRGLKWGRSFVTNGPILEFESGRTLRLGAPGAEVVKARVQSAVPIDRFELVRNGEVVAAGALAADHLSGTIEEKVELKRSGWLSVRAFAGRLQAHSSPIYVEVGGRPAGSKADAEGFLAWIDRLEEQFRTRDRAQGGELRKQVLAQLDLARDVYRKVAARSE